MLTIGSADSRVVPPSAIELPTLRGMRLAIRYRRQQSQDRSPGGRGKRALAINVRAFSVMLRTWANWLASQKALLADLEDGLALVIT